MTHATPTTSPARRLYLLRALITMLESGVKPAQAYDLVTAEARDASWLEADPVCECLLTEGRGDGTGGGFLRHVLSRLEVEVLMAARVSALKSRLGTLCTMAVLTFTAGLVWVVPQFSSIFESMNVQLPVLTETLMRAAVVAEDLGPTMVLAGSVLALIFAAEGLARFGSRLPLIGRLYRRRRRARLRRDLGSLLGSSVSPLRALEALARRSRAERDPSEAAMLCAASSFVIRGETLAGGLARAGADPALVALVRAGEEGGEIAALLLADAASVEQALADTLRRLTAAVLPVMVIGTAIAAGFVVLALFMPMLRICNCVG